MKRVSTQSVTIKNEKEIKDINDVQVIRKHGTVKKKNPEFAIPNEERLKQQIHFTTAANPHPSIQFCDQNFTSLQISI